MLFIDEIDAITTERSEAKISGVANVHRTIINIHSKMDGFDSRGNVRIIAATNRFDILGEGILRPGRYDRFIGVLKSHSEDGCNIFQIHTRDVNTDENFDFDHLATTPKMCPVQISKQFVLKRGCSRSAMVES